jgi:hypothetical protein
MGSGPLGRYHRSLITHRIRAAPRNPEGPFFENYSGLTWGPPQIAHDVIRLKSRLLFDFFGPRRKDDDITFDDFSDLVPEHPFTEDATRRLAAFKSRVNAWTVHLSWRRALESEYSPAERREMEEHALELLSHAKTFVDACLGHGLQLTESARARLENFERLDHRLRTTPRILEGKGQRPPSAEQIRLTDPRLAPSSLSNEDA